MPAFNGAQGSYTVHRKLQLVSFLNQIKDIVTCRRKAGILEPAYMEQLSTFPPQRTTTVRNVE
jgi:hypothetical protein